MFGKVLLERLQLLTLVLNNLQQGIDSGKGLVEALQQGLVVLTVSRIHAVMDDMEVALTLEAQGDGGQVVAIDDAGDELAFGLHAGTLLRHVEGDGLVEQIRPRIHRLF